MNDSTGDTRGVQTQSRLPRVLAIAIGALLIAAVAMLGYTRIRQAAKNEAAPPAQAPAPAAEASASIVLGAEARANIKLETAAATMRVIERTLLLNATLQVVPDREAFVSSRVLGKVTAVRANVGEMVSQGAPLVSLQSLQIAETPPVIDVTSPLAGIVVERRVTVGETVDPSRSLFRVADLSLLLAQAEVYEADIAKVRRGQTGRLRVAAYPERSFTARIVRLAGTIDAERRTMRVWLEVANTPDFVLKPDMFGQIALVVGGTGTAAVTVPTDAVQTIGPERFVFVRNGDAFMRQNVVVGEADDRFTAISVGLIAGDEVVTRGAAELRALVLQPARGGGVVDESKPHTHP